jgi:hypothetical protein
MVMAGFLGLSGPVIAFRAMDVSRSLPAKQSGLTDFLEVAMLQA